MMANSARRLEVVRNCITYIFENKMLEAKKVNSSPSLWAKGGVSSQSAATHYYYHFFFYVFLNPADAGGFAGA